MMSDSDASGSLSDMGEEEADASVEEQKQPDSLATISCRAVEKSLIDEFLSIPDEAAATTADRRRKLRLQMMKLDDEEEAYIKKREKELSAKRDDALKHMKSVDGPDSYCAECNEFYKTFDKSDNRCCVETCVKHISCPGCFDQIVESCFFENESSGDALIDCWEEQNEDGSPSAKGSYNKCWLCDKEFCNPCFAKHYSKCRANASKRCGFRPPTGENSGGYLCVPGHCGKVLVKSERIICYPDDGVCCTVSCKDCIDICGDEVSDEYHNQYFVYPDRGREICGERRCKLCIQKDCYGRCTYGW